MSAAGAVKDYGSHESAKQKQHWRRWFWNRITERLPKPASECNVLGLFGADGLDYPEMERRGFDLRRVICVEANSDAARRAKMNGANVLHGDLEDVVSCWNGTDGGKSIDVLVADLCGGLSIRTARLAAVLVAYDCLCDDGVVAVNLLRGRDRYGKTVLGRQFEDAKQQSIGLYRYSPSDPRAKKVEDVHNALAIHRGVWFSKFTIEAYHYFACHEPIADESAGEHPLKMADRVHRTIAISDYSSGRNKFDSAVFNLQRWQAMRCLHQGKKTIRMRRKIAAAKAHMTMRLQSK